MPRATVIEIVDDKLVEDAALAVDWKTTRRSLARYDLDGLPFVIVGRRKMRPLKACREWLKDRIVQRGTGRRGRPRG